MEIPSEQNIFVCEEHRNMLEEKMQLKAEKLMLEKEIQQLKECEGEIHS